MEHSATLILNVDDNDGARYAKTRILQVAGFNVIEASNGTDALAMVVDRKPDLVLLDVKLPDINGIEVCRRIKSAPESSSVLVLQTSAALTASADKVRGLEGGADNYLAAPIEAGELIANVNALLRLRSTQAQLRESEERFRQLAENIHDVFWIFSFSERTPLYVSTAYEMLWGARTGSLAENPDCWLDSVHAEDREHVRASFNRLFSGAAYAEEFRIVRPDGAESWIFDRAFPVRNGQGDVYRVARISTDISAAKNAERALREADVHKDQFLATLAHELRSPLGPIRNAVELMHRVSPADNALHLQARDIITRQVDHLARLVDDLLDVARISRGKIALQKSPVELASFIGSAVETTRPFIEARGHTLDVRLPSARLWVDGDPVRLGQIVGNLLNNAAKYTPHGGQIGVEAALAGEALLRVTVSDNGIGVSADAAGNIFDMFTQGQTAPDRAQDGLGIGLSLVKQLVELHGGRISLDSAGAGRGSRFHVHLPLLNTEPAAASTIAPLNGGKAMRKVLIVDDNRDAANITSMLLDSLGYAPETAYDPSSAIETAREFLPDVVLLDIGLPGMDGYQVARILRELPELAHTRLIAMTGYGAEKDRQRALEAGFEHHITKPVDLKQLVACLEAGKESR